MSEWIYGRRTVAEHLRAAPETCRRLVLAPGSGIFDEILRDAEKVGIPVERAGRNRLDRLAQGGTHQGVCLEVGGWDYWELEDIAARAREPQRLPVLVALDSVQDPRNLGAVLRVIDGAGAAGVLIPKDRAVGINPSVARSASGALASTPVARVVNLGRALDELRRGGFWLAGTACDAPVELCEVEVVFPAVLVFGGEHRGMRPNVARRCDVEFRLPMAGKVSSLNLAVACGVTCYELLRRFRDSRRVF